MARNNYKSEKRRKELQKLKKRQDKELRKQRKAEGLDEEGQDTEEDALLSDDEAGETSPEDSTETPADES